MGTLSQLSQQAPLLQGKGVCSPAWAEIGEREYPVKATLSCSLVACSKHFRVLERG